MAMIGGNSILKKFKVVRKLGAGNFGNVFEVEETDKKAAGSMACKEMPRTTEGTRDFEHASDQISFQCWIEVLDFLASVQEVEMLKLVGLHRNINQLRYWSQTTKSCFILLDMCYGGTLQDYVLELGGLTEHQAAAYMVKLLGTTAVIHSRGFDRSASSKDFNTVHRPGMRTKYDALQVCFTTT